MKRISDTSAEAKQTHYSDSYWKDVKQKYYRNVKHSKPEQKTCESITVHCTLAYVSFYLFYATKLNGNHVIMRQTLKEELVYMSDCTEECQ